MKSATTARPRHWIAVASAEHVAIGRAEGYMQVGHGKGAPLKRLHAGDRVAYYSPVRVFGGASACQAFTAIGTLRDERVYQGVMAGGFEPFRRDVAWAEAREAPIRPLLETLSFTRGRSSWGYAFRFGLLAVEAADMAVIARAMGALSMAEAIEINTVETDAVEAVGPKSIRSKPKRSRLMRGTEADA